MKRSFGWARSPLVTLLHGLVISLAFCAPASTVMAHEVTPTIANMQIDNGTLTLDVRANLEGFLAEIDLTTVADTNTAPQAATYDALRALTPEQLAEGFRAFYPDMAAGITAQTNAGSLTLALDSISVPEVGDVSLSRASTFRLTAAVPAEATEFVFGWKSEFGPIVLRQNGVENPYDGYLEAGAQSPAIAIAGGSKMSAVQAFLSYVPVGFDHIVPKGLDHILFVLGLFFLSTRPRTLIWQVSLFTLAHTITLALGALGYVRVPAAIVEPIIAASIVFVAVENILSDRLSRWRPLVVFSFGLLHGLGFASVLKEFGLPQDGFVAALIGFNIGVELGQLFVIFCAFLLVGLWFRDKPWYRSRISIPASAMIAIVGAYWFVERTLLAG